MGSNRCIHPAALLDVKGTLTRFARLRPSHCVQPPADRDKNKLDTYIRNKAEPEAP